MLKSEFYILQNQTIQRTSIENHIKHCLRAIVLTEKNERKVYPHLGSQVRDLLFRPIVPQLKMELEGSIREAITECEPRVELEFVEIKPSLDEPSKASVYLGYRVLETRKRDYVQFQL